MSKKIWTFFFSLNKFQAKFGVISFSGGGGGRPKIEVAQNVLKHVLIFGFFLRSDEIFEILYLS